MEIWRMITDYRYIILLFSVGIILAGGSYAADDPNDPNDPNTVAPNVIASASDWQLLMNTPAGWNKTYILTADIDLSGIAAMPIGTCEMPFTGVINGNGHVIQNLAIAAPDSNCVGPFGLVCRGRIYKLGLQSVAISGNQYVGGLVGYNIGGEIHSCYVTGSVAGRSYTGGLVGYNVSPAR